MSYPATNLQITLTPPDIPHAALIVPHQLRIWAPQCQEIMLVWEMDPMPLYPRIVAYRETWDRCLPLVEAFNQAICSDWPQTKIVVVDSSAERLHQLSKLFFYQGLSPKKDVRAGPFYSYLYGLWASSFDYVFHLDADMMFGGQSAHWLAEAHQALAADQSVLAVHPPGGPPPAAAERPTLRALSFTTRAYLMDRRRLYQTLAMTYRPLSRLLRDNPDPALWAEPYGDLIETLIERHMAAHGLCRLDLPGSEPGMWSLHPPGLRHPLFYPLLPQILEAICQNQLPAYQQGHYNLLPAVLQEFWHKNQAKKPG